MKSKEKIRICVDIDGVLSGLSGNWNGITEYNNVIPGSIKFLQELHKNNYIIIFSCRGHAELNTGYSVKQLYALMEIWLTSNGLEYDEIFVGQGKPIASFYVDDRAIVCKPEEDSKAFDKALDIIKKSLPEYLIDN